MSVILTNVLDNGIVAIKMSITQLKLRGGINNSPICFSLCAQEQHIVHCPVRRRSQDLSLEQSMPADEKAHSGSMLAGEIVSRNS